MPSRTLLICAGIGVVVIAALIGSGLFVSRGAHLRLDGNIQKVRTAALGDGRSLVVLDFRVSNPADYPFQIKSADVVIEIGKETLTGRYVPEVDTKVLFQAKPELGEKYNPTIQMKESIAPKQSVDRMVGGVFEIPLAKLESRKSLKLLLKDADGPVAEIR